MTKSQTDATNDPQTVIAALQQKLDEGLAREAALVEELTARDATFALHKTEFDERIEYQAATLDILTTMSASPGDAQPVLDLIVRHATELCNVPSATLFEYDGELVHIRSDYRSETILAPSALATYIQLFPMHPARGSISCRAILDRQIIHIRDLRLDPELADFARELGHRSQVSVPLIRNDLAIGVITIGAQAAGGFSDRQVELLKTFAKQAVIAITSAETYRALQERTVALAQRNTEYGERIEHQSATIDVLKAMSASPGEPQPVFDLIVDRARDLCDAYGATVFEFDGTGIHWRAATGVSDDPAVRAAYEAQFPMAPTRGWAFGRAILDRRIIRIDDMEAEPGLDPTLRGITAKSNVTTPIMRGDEVIGAIGMGSREKGGFSDSQVELLKTFAEQAVIAITSAETYRALQSRTSDLQETLEYQTATSDVLKVISRSAFDLQPVLDTLVETAARLCDADMAGIGRREGELVRGVAFHGYPPEYRAWIKSLGAMPLDRHIVGHRAALEGRVVHVHDVAAEPNYPTGSIALGKMRTSLGVPLLREGETVGSIVLARKRVEPFTDRQIELVSTFADQAVIAIENTRLITEQREALEQQTATAEVLQVINASPGNLTPVFEAMLDKAIRLCDATYGHFRTYDGEGFPLAAVCGDPSLVELHRQRMRYFVPGPHNPISRFRRGEDLIHISDAAASEAYGGDPGWRELVDTGACRSVLAVALRKDTALLGYISVYRQEVRAFSERQIALLENFAAQAVIAMENARLLTEQREALEQQTATAEVLQVINASPGNLQPVFEAILEKAHNLCDVAVGSLSIYLNGVVHTAATRGFSQEYQALLRRPYPAIGSHQALMRGGPSIQTPDFRMVPVSPVMASSLDHLERMKLRTGLWVPLRKDGTALGCISSYRDKVQPFSGKEIALLENFAAQAVIAMENARLLDEIRQRQAELRVTFDNMGDGVVMFDAEHRLAAWNRNFQALLDIPDAALAKRPSYADYLRLLAQRGEFGAEDIEAELTRRLVDTDRELRLERTRPDGRAIELRRNPVPDGGFVLIYSDISERKRSEAEIGAARDAAEAAYRDLKAVQANLIQAEKMASLGQLTAGIAHEIKNPLNFVNNFAALSVDLLAELKETAAPGFAALTQDQRAEIDDVSAMLTSNLEKITEHGKRADGIVKAMLEHSRGSSAERRMVDLNVLIDEALNLAYHGARAQDQSFNITLERDFGQGIAPIEVNPQDMTRAFLSLFSNGFYAATKRARNGEDVRFEPTLKVTTRNTGDAVEIRVRDNGTGIQADIRDKLFQPFFTTKPTGEGTGLGLSITYDIVTKAHGGSIAVDSKVCDYSEFTIRLPRNL